MVICGLGLIIGLLLGFIGGYFWVKDELVAMSDVTTSHFIASEVEANMGQYFSASPEVGMYALQTNIRLLESQRKRNSKILDEKVLAWDLVLSYARLGKLAEKLGKKEVAERAFSHALDTSKQTGQEFKSLSDLLQLVEKLDNNAKKTRREKGNTLLFWGLSELARV